MTNIPLLATGAFTLNSPVEGLYSRLAFPVYTVKAVPEVALANNGYRLLAVLVSFAIAAPPTEAQAVPL